MNKIIPSALFSFLFSCLVLSPASVGNEVLSDEILNESQNYLFDYQTQSQSRYSNLVTLALDVLQGDENISQ